MVLNGYRIICVSFAVKYMYKTWYDLGIAKIIDIYDYNEKACCYFGNLRAMYNIQSQDFLKYLKFNTMYSKQLESKSQT